MSSHTLNGTSVHFGFGLKTSFIGLFKIIGEFLSKSNYHAHYRIISTIRKQQYQNVGKKPPQLPFNTAFNILFFFIPYW